MFVLYALFTEPGLFRRYAAGAPSLGYDGRLVLKLEAEYATRHRSLPAAVVMSTGSRDVDEDAEAYQQLDATLRSRGYEGLRYNSFVLEGETHLSGPAPAFVTGVRALVVPDFAL